MEIDVHIQQLQRSLSARPCVVTVDKSKAIRLPKLHNRAKISARLYFFDNSFLEIDQAIDTYKCYPQHPKYSYQYISSSDEQIFRYDNVRHHPDVETFPHHKHIGPDEDENIIASGEPSLSEVLDEIKAIILSSYDEYRFIDLFH